MASTQTYSRSSTFSEARVVAVMHKVLADLVGLAATGMIDEDTAEKWHEELEFILLRRGATYFQFQFRLPSGSRAGLTYRVSDDGSLSEDSDSGGVDWFDLPKGTKASLFLHVNEESPHLAEVRSFMSRRGWGAGSVVEGTGTRERAYSKDGFGLVRERVGAW